MNRPRANPPSAEEVVERLMNAAAETGAPEYEVYMVQRRSLAIAAQKGRIDQVRRNDEAGAALRIVDRGRLGFAYTSVFTPEAIKHTAAQAAAAAELSDPIPGLALPTPPAGPWPEVDGSDPDAGRVSHEAKMDRVLAMEAAALDYDPRIERVRQAEYRESDYTLRLANSHGLTYENSGAVFSGSLMAKAADGDEAETGYEGDFSRRHDRLDLTAIAREAARRAVESLGGRKIAGGKGAVLLENHVVADFLGVLSSSFLADSVHKGKSMLAGKAGQRIMSAGLILHDDGLYPGGLATSPADAEGTPKQRTVLVDRGVLTGYLYDETRARVDGTASTGNAGRGGYKGPPGNTPTNLILLPGTRDLPELCRDLDNGLLITDVMGVHTANAISGDFSLGVSGIRLRSGRPDHPVKGMALAGNILDLFDRVAEIGADLKLFGSIGAPSLLVEKLTLSGL